MLDNKIIEQILGFMYLGYIISGNRPNPEVKLDLYNKTNCIINSNLGKQILSGTKNNNTRYHSKSDLRCEA
jgi:hypothetical protein